MDRVEKLPAFLASAFLAVSLSLIAPFGAWSALPGAAALASAAIAFGVRRKPRRLQDRALAIANRVRECDPRGYKSPPFDFSSPLGMGQTMVKHIERIERHRPPRRGPRSYTRSLHDQVVAVAEELAECGYSDAQVTYLLGSYPPPGNLDQLAIAVCWMADRLNKDEKGLRD